MAVFRVERNKGYTVMSNHHLRNKELTLKAKGLLSQMLSLPEDWDFTLAGLSYINQESIDAIRTAVWELEKAGYITRQQGRDDKGKMTAIEYTIYEQPQIPPGLEKPILENPTPGSPNHPRPIQGRHGDSAADREDEGGEGIVKYYVTSDVHGFYTPLRAILTKAGYFDDTEPHKLLIAGDLFDRGREAVELQSFILGLLERDEVILIRGNHEDLFEELVTVDHGMRYDHHLSNGTYSTALQLTGFDKRHAKISPLAFARTARETPYYTTILPAMIDYYETDSFVFTHGWIPCVKDEDGSLSYMDGWREAPEQSWRQARWINGIDAVRTVFEDGKTIVCGHWHTSYGHSKYEGMGTEFGKDADFSPYIAPGIIALDACTAYSGIVNCIIVEDG